MTTMVEEDIEITATGRNRLRKFDDDTHGLSHCMKAVDFIMELKDKILFIEIKDPDDPRARPENREEFIDKFKSENLDNDLVYKYRDSFLYEWASGKTREIKPVHYLVLIAASGLTEAELLTRADALKRKLPVPESAPDKWKKPLITDCSVFNIATWNKHIKHCRVTRISEL